MEFRYIVTTGQVARASFVVMAELPSIARKAGEHRWRKLGIVLPSGEDFYCDWGNSLQTYVSCDDEVMPPAVVSGPLARIYDAMAKTACDEGWAKFQAAPDAYSASNELRCLAMELTDVADDIDAAEITRSRG